MPPAELTARPTAAIDVGVLDDHPIVRRALSAVLATQDGIRVRGEASSVAEALELLRAVALDVLVLDLGMPGRTGLDAISLIRSLAPRTAVLVFTGYPEDEYGVKLIRLGADAYLHKTCALEELFAAIRTIALGRRYLTASLSELMANQVGRPPSAAHSLLTDRELQVMLKLARGVRPMHIAAQLSLSVKTVSTYRTRLLNKLDLKTNGDLTYYAMKHGLMD
ncbi:response regulator transcription factor [Variovorax sp. J22P271]|uniref:response regulator n=1 Tax=Variovorax davisae TaxID=3053515 RepID=UPI002577EE41|nr:response regulator transcription factor [Variovorax sp. J22P271]MDM0032185.1 response regulator transcription factor [Variovorax sp. J22P271]